MRRTPTKSRSASGVSAAPNTYPSWLVSATRPPTAGGRTAVGQARPRRWERVPDFLPRTATALPAGKWRYDNASSRNANWTNPPRESRVASAASASWQRARSLWLPGLPIVRGRSGSSALTRRWSRGRMPEGWFGTQQLSTLSGRISVRYGCRHESADDAYE
jgi:hypothetical protein